MIDCPYCSMSVTQLEMDGHVASCRAAKAAGAKPTGQSAQLRQRLSEGPRARRGTATAASGRHLASVRGICARNREVDSGKRAVLPLG